MIPKITKGNRPYGIVSYLVGAGRHNEHIDPHLVAGSPTLMAWFDDAQLNEDSARELAHELDLNRRAFGFGSKEPHVWQCSLSLHYEEGELGDEKWHDVVQSFMDKMDFTDAGSKAPCTWAAVHHGQNVKGNDHVHIVASRIREDGTKWSAGVDYKRAQKACRELEREHDLRQVSGTTSQRWLSRAEVERQGQEHNGPVRFRIERTVRACAMGSDSEAQFVRRMRRANLIVRPRFASGSDAVVTGFSVAERAPQGMRPLFYGGGKLAKDLTLTSLRTRWDDTLESASNATDEWRAAKRGQRIVHHDPAVSALDEDAARRMAEELSEMRRRMRSVPVTDHQQWSHLARETSGVLAAWSFAVEDGRDGPLARAARTVSRSAQRSDTRFEPLPVPLRLTGTAAFLVAVSQAPPPMAQALVMSQLARTIQSVYEMHQAAGELAEMQRIDDIFKHELQQIAGPLPEVDEVPAAHAGPVQELGILREAQVATPRHRYAASTRFDESKPENGWQEQSDWPGPQGNSPIAVTETKLSQTTLQIAEAEFDEIVSMYRQDCPEMTDHNPVSFPRGPRQDEPPKNYERERDEGTGLGL